jgi:tripartite-type tricarboxylate transporter receptor subunit TctC
LIASNHVAKAAPDGRTLLLAVTPTIQAPFLFTTTSIDPTKAFRPIAQLFDARLWFAVSTKVGADSVAGFLDAARTKKDFSYSTPGAGSTPHLNALQLSRQAKVEMLHVPYRGVSPAVVDLAGGRVTSTFASYSDLLPHVSSGNIKVLASTGDSRSPLTPNVPSMREAGYAGFDVIGFGGIVAPAGTPDGIVNDVARDIHQAMANAKLQERLVQLGLEPVKDSGPQAFGQVIDKQSVYWKKVIAEAGVKAE